MPFYELDENEMNAFLGLPEISSGVQIGKMWQSRTTPNDEFEIVFVFCGRVAF